METNTKREEGLVELLLKSLEEADSPEIKTLVGHKFPDDDVWLCLWVAKRFIPKARNAEIVFVNAGEILPGSEGDSSVIHFDTGCGEYDQHGDNDVPERTCSAAILAEKTGILASHPGLKPLLEMVTKVDNIEEMSETELHYLTEGYPYEFNKDWAKVQEMVFLNFNIIYKQAARKEENRKRYPNFAETTVLANGLKVVLLLGHPELRDVGFEKGAAVVIWTKYIGKKFITGIFRNRKYRELRLDIVAADLRTAEAAARRIDVRGKNLTYIRSGEPITTWYLGKNKSFILNGSRTNEIGEDQFTKLFPRPIAGIAYKALSAIPKETISSWNIK